MNYAVIKAYTRSRDNPVAGRAGDILATGETYNWDGHTWVWCKDASGREGWIAEAVLERDGSKATLKREFSALELSVEVGETIEGAECVAGWVLVSNSQGHKGWVPLNHLEMS